MQLAEAGEVGIVEQRPGRLVHPFEVGALEKSATILPVKRILGRRNVILVHARGGIKAGMRFGLHRPQAIHRDIRRQQAVQLVGHENFVQRTVGIKMGHHERSMYPRIRTPGPHYADLAAQQRRQRPFEALLYAHSVGLHLPAVVGRAVVSQINEISLHPIIFWEAKVRIIHVFCIIQSAIYIQCGKQNLRIFACNL